MKNNKKRRMTTQPRFSQESRQKNSPNKPPIFSLPNFSKKYMQFTPSNSTYFHSLPDPHLKNTNRPLAPRAPATTTIFPSARIRKGAPGRVPLHRLPRSASQRSRLLPGVPAAVGSPDSALVRVRGLPWRRRSRRRRWPRPSWRT